MLEPKVSLGPGLLIVRAAALPWQPSFSLPGVALKHLNRNPAVGCYTALIRVAPGAELPPHGHVGPEEMFFLEGTARLGEIRVEAGEYSRADAGSCHEALRTEHGCLLLISGSDQDQLAREV
jgi:anti-sigma factor ChrR (cupin superfamily)